MPATLLIDKIKDTENICSWNKTLLKSQVLKRINDTVGISYQVNWINKSAFTYKVIPKVTTDATGGLVSSRDFVYLFKTGYDGDSWVMAGKSIEYKYASLGKGIVRADNGPGLQMVTPCQVWIRIWVFVTWFIERRVIGASWFGSWIVSTMEWFGRGFWTLLCLLLRHPM